MKPEPLYMQPIVMAAIVAFFMKAFVIRVNPGFEPGSGISHIIPGAPLTPHR